MEKIEFDDIDALKAKVSDEFGPFGASIAHGFLTLLLLPALIYDMILLYQPPRS